MGVFDFLRDGYCFAASSIGVLAPSSPGNMPGRYTPALQTGAPTATPTTPARDYEYGAAAARSTLLWAWDGLKGAAWRIGDAYAAASSAVSTMMGLGRAQPDCSVAGMDEEMVRADEDYEVVGDPDAEEMDRLNDAFRPSVLNMPGYRRVAAAGSGEHSMAEETGGVERT